MPHSREELAAHELECSANCFQADGEERFEVEGDYEPLDKDNFGRQDDCALSVEGSPSDIEYVPYLDR